MPLVDTAPSVRVASAGTGKTTSLVLRYLQLIDEGVPLRRIAGITFTRAAADELRQRVGQAVQQVQLYGHYMNGLFRATGDSEQSSSHLRARSASWQPAPAAPQGSTGPTPQEQTGPELQDPTRLTLPAARFAVAANELQGAVLTTIHGFMISCLRLNAPQLGLDPGFGVMAEWEAQALFETELQSLLMLAQDPEHHLYEATRYLGNEAVPKARRLFLKRSLAERLRFGSGPEEVALAQLYEAAIHAFDSRMGAFSLAPAEIERRAVHMLTVSAAARRVAARFPRVLVDEYQDVNPLQGTFFERLATVGVQLELVGDPKQSIYGFRNADVTVFRRALAQADQAGKTLPALVESRRHSQAVLAFLNRMTEHLAASDKGFSSGEASHVVGAGQQASQAGTVELHVVAGEVPLAEVRRREAELLAERLTHHKDAGVPYERMAVLARSYTGLALVQRALSAAGVPSVLGQGRGYYERPEIRDVHHALSVGVDPTGPSLGPFLRGPFAALQLAEIGQVLEQEGGRLEVLAFSFPGVAERMAWLSEMARLRPLQALTKMLRERVLDGRSYLELLDGRARENVDALLFEVAARPPADLSLLLDRLDKLARQADAAEVPQSGAGVRLLTVHASKGLEFDLTALFDTGAWPRRTVDEVIVEPATGQVRLVGSDGYQEAAGAERARQRQESYRLLYVAASRARNTLILTGSRGSAGAAGWLTELLGMGLSQKPIENVTVRWHDYQRPARLVERPKLSQPPLQTAPYITSRFEPLPAPPVTSPTRLEDAHMQDEPLPAAVLANSDQEIERGAVGWGRARGTLVHYAIGQNWSPEAETALQTLRAQEVLFPFNQLQKAELIAEVAGLLGDYMAMLGTDIPALEEREVDRAELPLAVRRGDLVWEGVVDRLYRVKDTWYLDDYKTDREVVPERYMVQLGLYLEALQHALGERPRGRLVYLRSRKVIEPDQQQLEQAVARAFRSEEPL